jgi:hypothetical protein
MGRGVVDSSRRQIVGEILTKNPDIIVATCMNDATAEGLGRDHRVRRVNRRSFVWSSRRLDQQLFEAASSTSGHVAFVDPVTRRNPSSHAVSMSTRALLSA